jgi:Glu-tRNA(Gln) amidotransferase subunit E-like FAD-binding protein
MGGDISKMAKGVVMKSNLREALKQFHELPKAGQDSLLSDLHRASKENALLIENRLLGSADFSDLIAKMERETIGKVYRRGIPGMIDGRKVNAIISAAVKARADYTVLMQLEQLAYRGFTEFLHEYGGGPDNYDDMGAAHLAAYLRLVKENYSPEAAADIFEQVRRYITKKDNMIQDYNFDAFESVTDIKCY